MIQIKPRTKGTYYGEYILGLYWEHQKRPYIKLEYGHNPKIFITHIIVIKLHLIMFSIRFSYLYTQTHKNS